MTRVPELATERAANCNRAVVELVSVGDGRAFYRTLARIIVRRELISMGVIADPERCEAERLAG